MTLTESSAIPEVANQAEQSHEKSPQESFAELRKAKEALERDLWQARKEKELFEKQIASQQQAQLMQQRQAQQQPEEEDFNLEELAAEEFPDGKKLTKAFKSFDRKLSGYNQKLTEKDAKIAALETAIEYPDFREVVTAENIEKYIKSDEDFTEAVEKAANPLRKAYNLIKKSAGYLNDKQAKEKPISQEQKRVDDKVGKPQVGSLGVRSDAISTAARLSNSTMSKEQRNTLWKETQAASRR